MKKINYIPLVALGACTVSVSCAKEKKATNEKPNIILIMADDMGWGDTGFNGNTIIKTPELDKLAADGVVLDRFYSGCAVSSPTRASVLTGRNPYRTGIFTANLGIMRPQEVTIPEMLAPEGYMSGHFGKWHLGTLSKTVPDANRGGEKNKNLFNPPKEHSYVDACVTESKVPTYDPMIAPIRDGKKVNYWDYLKPEDAREDFGTGYWNIESQKVTENLEGNDSRVVMDRVLPFIDTAVDANKPFFSVVWFHAPHLPCVAGPEHQALYPGTSLEERNYYGCITALDDQVGRLVQHLKDAGIYENTVIMFCSDNGPENGTPGSTGGLTGRKRAIHEGGIRVPAFMVWKKEIKGGTRSSIPCFTSDYLPLAAELSGAQLPKDRELDGQSFLPAMLGKKWERKKPLVFLFQNKGAVMDKEMKLYYEAGKYSLYNIDEDRAEKNDLSEQYPEVTERLKKVLNDEVASFERSFTGEEYNDASVLERVPQKWESIFTYKSKAPKAKK